MTPEELALFEALVAQGLTPEQAYQIMAEGSLAAPVPVRPWITPEAVPESGGMIDLLTQMQQGVGNLSRPATSGPEVMTAGGSARNPLDGVVQPLSTIQGGNLGAHPTSGYMGQETGIGSALGYERPPIDHSLLWDSTAGFGDIQTWPIDDNTGYYAPNSPNPGPEYPKERRVNPTPAQVAARLVASGKAGAQQQMQSQSQRQPQARTQTQTQQPPPSGGGRAPQKAAQPAFRARAADRRKA